MKLKYKLEFDTNINMLDLMDIVEKFSIKVRSEHTNLELKEEKRKKKKRNKNDQSKFSI